MMPANARAIDGAEFYQWMRNREGGQTFGTRSMIAPLNEAIFAQFLKPCLRWFYASSAAAYRARHPRVTHVHLYQTSGEGPWKLGNADALEALRPLGRAGRMFARRVTAFGTPSAITWGRTADSDVYPLGSYELYPDGPTEIPGGRIPGSRQLGMPNPIIMVGLGMMWVGILGLLFDGNSEKRAAR